MYHIKITTKYNVINLEVDDYNTPEMQEIFNQPYVLEVKMEKIDEKVGDFTKFDCKNVENPTELDRNFVNNKGKTRKLTKGNGNNGKKKEGI